MTVILFAYSCQYGTKRVIADLSEQRDTLQALTIRQEEQLEEMQNYLRTMTMSLDSIAIEEGMLFLPDPETPNSPLSQKQLKIRLERFQELVDRQYSKIKELEDSLDINNATLSNMKSLVSYFRTTIEKKEVEIEELKKSILKKDASIRQLKSEVGVLKEDISSLNEVNAQQQMIMDAQDEILNEGYYLVGTKKELASLGIRTSKLSNSNLDMSLFTKVDIRSLSALNIYSSKLTILTPMPQSSFSFIANNDGSTTLRIDSPADFWQFSNILIIQVR